MTTNRTINGGDSRIERENLKMKSKTVMNIVAVDNKLRHRIVESVAQSHVLRLTHSLVLPIIVVVVVDVATVDTKPKQKQKQKRNLYE